jgi:hypothetical protein
VEEQDRMPDRVGGMVMIHQRGLIIELARTDSADVFLPEDDGSALNIGAANRMSGIVLVDYEGHINSRESPSGSVITSIASPT